MQESPTRDVNVVNVEPLKSPADLAKEIPTTPAAEQTVLEGRQQIRRVLRGEDPRILIVVGP